MKIAVRGGHNIQATGASVLLDEVTEDRKVCAAVIKYLKMLGNEVLDVTPGPMSKNSDLAYGVNKATKWGAELFISIHFNNAYKRYNGAIGTETIIYPHSKTAYPFAKRINDNLVKLGFKKHGEGVINDTRGLYELRHTRCAAVITEVCFVEATQDVALYRKLGPDEIGKAVAEGIVSKTISTSTNRSQSFKSLPLKMLKDAIAFKIENNKPIKVKEFFEGQLITARDKINEFYLLDINGVKAYITVNATTDR